MSMVPIPSMNDKSMLDLRDDDLQYFCSAIESRAGIALKSSKRDLVRARLRSRIAAHGFETYQDYRNYLSSISKNDPEWELFTNLLTTNKTDFFREPMHFTYLVQKILPAWLKTSQKTFNVWSSASSTGEEAYTLAMVLQRHLPKDRDYKVLASDIDTEVIQIVRNAVYSTAKKSEIPIEYHASCLDFGTGETRGWFRIKSHIKEKVHAIQHNLIEHSIPGENMFDLVLCRNVLIYFAPESIDFVQSKMFTATKKGGHLFIGHSESLQGVSHRWMPVGPSIFKKDA